MRIRSSPSWELTFPAILRSRWSFIGRLIYETPVQGLRLAVTGARLETDYDPRFFPPMIFGPGKYLRAGDFFGTVQGRALEPDERVRSPANQGRRLLARIVSTSTSWARAITSRGFIGSIRTGRWCCVTMCSTPTSTIAMGPSKAEAAACGVNLSAHFQFAKDWTVGVRYNITPSWMVRAEYHNVYGGTLYLFPQDNPDPFALGQEVGHLRAAVVLPLLGDGGAGARRLDRPALGGVYPGAGEAAFRSSLMPCARLPGPWRWARPHD